MLALIRKGVAGDQGIIGRAKYVIMVFMCGGASHLDIRSQTEAQWAGKRPRRFSVMMICRVLT